MRISAVLLGLLGLCGGCSGATAQGPAAQGSGGRSALATDVAGSAPASEDEAERMEEVRRVCVRKASSAMSRCWNAEYTRTGNAKVEAQVEVLIMVAPSGSASDVKILANQGGSSELAACVVAETRSWTYPEGKSTTPVDCRFFMRSSQ